MPCYGERMAHVAMLGTGMIGTGMVERWLDAKLDVAVWNRSADKTSALATRGARAEIDPSAAVRGASRIHIALSDDAAVDGVLDRAMDALSDAVVIDHTTTSPKGTEARAARLASRGVKFIHAPVFMSPAMCREGKGIMLAAGPSTVFESVKEALAAMTGDVWNLGEASGAAAAYKLFGNTMILTIGAGLADVFAIAKSCGMTPDDALSLFAKFNPAGTLSIRGAKMAKGDYTPSFELSMARKDVRLMIEAADGEPLAVLPSVAARMDKLIADGFGKHDVGILAVGSVPERKS
jgi:3-hydroxyisobutyrate dehydrogenase